MNITNLLSKNLENDAKFKYKKNWKPHSQITLCWAFIMSKIIKMMLNLFKSCVLFIFITILF